MPDIMVSKVLIHITAVLILFAFFFILKMKEKQRIHYYCLILAGLIFVWNISLIADMYVKTFSGYSGMFLINVCFTAVSGVSVFIFLLGVSFTSFAEIRPVHYLVLLLLPIFTDIMLWTNNYHHLFFVEFTDINAEIIRGPVAYLQAAYAYCLLIFGIGFLVYYMIKNAGFFSQQSLLIAIGTVIPVGVDIAFVFNLASFSMYYEPISFSIGVLCFLLAILKYDFLNIIPIALQTIVDHISDNYVVINEKCIVIDFNRPFYDNFSALTNIKRKMSIWEMLDGFKNLSQEGIDNFLSSLSRTRQGAVSAFCEVRFKKEEFDRMFAVEITPIISHSQYRGTIILFKDISELKNTFELVKQAQAQLIEREHLVSLGQLVGGIAHNLKTPIMSISGGVEGISELITEIEESADDPQVVAEDYREIAAEMREWTDKIKNYCSYMSDIISTVKGQAVQLTATTTDQFSLNELLKRIDILMNHELKKYGCKLNVVCKIEKSSMILGEVNSLVQVINNLIANSIESYAGEAGEIDFTITREGPMLRTSVRDYGCGMPDDVKNKLFREMITTKAKNGTGLGLYMSYSTIVGKFGGQMWFESEAGKGTDFVILIPMAEETAQETNP